VRAAPLATSNRRKAGVPVAALRWIVSPLPTMVRLSLAAMRGRPVGPNVLLYCRPAVFSYNRKERGEGVGKRVAEKQQRGSPTVAPPVLELQLDRSERRKIEERRHREKDARIGYRLSALLWLAEGRSLDEVASLLGRSVRTIRNWVKLYKKRGLW